MAGNINFTVKNARPTLVVVVVAVVLTLTRTIKSGHRTSSSHLWSGRIPQGNPKRVRVYNDR